MPRPNDEEFPEAEASRRFESALRAALKTPPKPAKDLPRKDRRRKAVTSGRKAAASEGTSRT